VKHNLAIFDIDGTLTDSVAVHQTAFISALADFGLFDYEKDFSTFRFSI
jgi:beta-phosphoglucomutase-like phosphatase (HAD superfamily)